MKIMIFTEGTILMARGAAGHSRNEIVYLTSRRDVKDVAERVAPELLGEGVKMI